VVTFPHAPFTEGIKDPEGRGGKELEDDGTTREEEGVGVDVGGGGLEVGGGGLELGGGVEDGTGVDDGIGGAFPHLPYAGWHPTISPQNSNSFPQ